MHRATIGCTECNQRCAGHPCPRRVAYEVVRHRLDWQTYSLVATNDQLLHLHHDDLSVVISTQGNVPAIVYWGNALGASSLQSHMFTRAVLGGGIDLDPPLGIIPQHHDGWLGTSGIEGCFQDGSGSFPHFVIESSTHTTTSATFILCDDHLDLELELNLKIHPSGVLALDGSFTNRGSLPYLLHSLRFALPVPSRAEELLTLGGRWGMEFGRDPLHSLCLAHPASRPSPLHSDSLLNIISDFMI